MIYTKICQLCGKEFKSSNYQTKYCNDEHYLKCQLCGKEFKIDNQVLKRPNLPKTCSKECRYKLSKQTSFINNPIDPTNVNKAKNTRLKKYGSYESIETKNKRKLTCLDKYNSPNSINLEKAKKTKLEKYGNENYNNREKFKQTSLCKYGVDNPSKNKDIQDKIVNTNKLHWGVDYTFKTINNKNKSKATKLKKYNNPYFVNSEKANATKYKKYGKGMSDEAIENMRQTKLNKYGYSSWNLDEATITFQERYGVPYYCMTEECRKASRGSISQINLKFKEALENIGLKPTIEFVLDKYQYDIKIDDILIELDPTFTHNSTIGPLFSEDSKIQPKDKYYHQNKSKIAKENNFRCIHIFDWDDKDKIINLLKPKTLIYARKCNIKEVSLEDTTLFLNTYHLQNSCKGQTIRLGLYYNNELIQLMTFGKPRYNKNYEYELLRLCTKTEYKIIGGAERLFKYFLEKYNPSSIISYCDLAKFNGNVYERLGFKLLNITQPAKRWSKGNKMITDNLLRQRGYDQLFNTTYGKGTSNDNLMLENDWLEIYDCGQGVFIRKI